MPLDADFLTDIEI